MAAPAYTEDLTDLTLAEATTGFSALGGGAAGLGAGIDFAIQGTNCIDKQVTSTGAPVTKGMIYDNGSTITNATDLHYFVWLFVSTPGIMDSEANGGKIVTLGTSVSAYMDFYVGGNDTFPGGGVRCYPVRYTTTATSTRVKTGTPGADAQWVGGQLTITGSARSQNLGVDAMRYGTGAYITAGDGTTPATFDGFATQNDSSTNRWGILSLVEGIYQLQGRFVVGQNNSQTPTAAHFDDTGSVVTFTDTPHSATDFTQIIVDHASTIFNATACTFLGLGTNNPGRFVVNNASSTVSLDACTFASMGISILRAGVTADACTWRSCDQITANAATITNSTITDYTGATDTSVLIWDDNVDPNGELDGTTFIKGAGTTHALELGTTSPLTITLTDVTFTGYGADATTSSAIHVKRTGGTVTINVTGGTTPTIKTDGATVNVINSVTVKVTAKDNVDSTAIENARIYLEADTGGDLPAGDSVTITSSGATATVTHTTHGLATGDYVIIRGANESEYLGDKQITVTTANAYTYTISGSPASPATGTITATSRILNELTSAAGIVQDTGFNYTTDQPVTGRARKGTTSPKYRTATLSGTITSTGFDVTTLLVSDE